MAVLPTGIGPVTSYNIERSLRFNSADSAYLSRTFGTPTNANVWTFSCWIKRSALGSYGTIIGRVGSTYPVYQFVTANTFGVYDSGSTTTTAVFRDPSAWYHLVIQRTNSTTVNVYFNNVNQLTTTGQTNAFNLSGQTYSIGKSNSGEYFDGYMTEVNFIDGQALTPSDFGETDSNTGVWKPKAYSGTYGTNGFYLKFADNSGTTSTTLGKDSSGNGNNWTPNNFSVTAGAGNDSLVDSPTSYGTDTGVGGEVRGNYCTLNPLDEPSTYAAAGSSANGNLDFSVSNDAAMGSTISVSSGKWYWEMTVVSGHSAGANTVWAAIASSTPSSVNKLPYQSGSGGRAYASNGSKYNENTTSSYGNTYTNNDVIGCALDLDNGKVYWSKNGTWQNSGDPVAGTNAAFTGLSGTWLPVAASNTALISFNFGQRAFAYTAPSGFKALCTQNLPTPTIGATSTTQANDYFDALLWTGNGTTQNITTANFQPDWLWVKERSEARSNLVWDAVRGSNLGLLTNSTNAESSQPSFTGFLSNGFGVSNTDASDITNKNAQTYVGWIWKANGAGSSNTAGTITSTVSANTTSGFSIVSFTSTGSQGTVGHGLGIAPSMIIMKQRSSVSAWSVYHVSIGNTKRLVLNATDAEAVDSIWGNTTPTSTVFTQNVSASTPTAIAYCFAAVAGYSAFGSYTGNGSADGPFVFTNFRPRYILRKRTDSTGGWLAQDSSRPGYNATTTYSSVLYPNASDAETIYNEVDILSNGFKIRATDTFGNASGGTYIYMAIAETPAKFSLAR